MINRLFGTCELELEGVSGLASENIKSEDNV